ncbi:MAG: hypothetical protein Fur0010_23070 [Bdellovibrio sp.]
MNSILLFLCIQSATAGLTPINEIFSPDESRFPRGDYMKVAVLQWANPIDTPVDVNQSEAERYKQTNREQISDYIEDAYQNGAELFITPEFAVVGYPSQPDADDNFASVAQAAPYAEEKQGPTFKYFSRIASTLKMYLHIGFLEKVKGEKLFYNSVMVINPQGQLVTVYHKQNLFGGEYKFIKPGTGPVTYQSPAGKIGLGVCADIYDYDFLSQYKNLKVDALSLSSSWTIHNSAYSYYQSAARELNTIIMGSNHSYYPDSGVVNADGTKQSHIRQSTGLAYGYLRLRK